MMSVDELRESADPGIVRPGAPEAPGDQFRTVGATADDIQQGIILVVVGREQHAVRCFELGDQRIDPANCLVRARSGNDRRADGGCALTPVKLPKQSLIKEIRLDGLDHRIKQFGKLRAAVARINHRPRLGTDCGAGGHAVAAAREHCECKNAGLREQAEALHAGGRSGSDRRVGCPGRSPATSAVIHGCVGDWNCRPGRL
jgi:hypothetical protein